MSNRRIYYAIEAVGIAPNGSSSFTAVHGLQSLGINTKFNLEQIFELGQLAIYQNYENVADIEATAEKCLDGYPLLGHLMTYGASNITLVGRANQRGTLGMSLYNDLFSSASGTPIQQCTCSGMYLQNWTFDVKLNGPATEAVTVIGNNKTWATNGVSGQTITFSPTFTNADVPLDSQGVNHRQHVDMVNSRFPTNIPGISSSGTNNGQSDGTYICSLQSIRLNVNLGRDELLQLGLKAPTFRYVNFPVEVRSDFEVLMTGGDLVSATEAGVLGNGNNLGSGDHIFVQMHEGTKIDCGTLNKLSGVTYGGANAGNRGGNATCTFSYITFNDFSVQHPQDPSPGLAG